MSDARSDRDRLLELLADRATIGLDDSELSDLEQLFGGAGLVDDLSLDLTAAAIDQAVDRESDVPLPDHVRSKVLAAAASAGSSGLAGTVKAAVAESRTASSRPDDAKVVLKAESGAMGRRDWVAWLVAAASVVFAGFVWFRRRDGQGEPGSQVASLEEQKQKFVEEASEDLIRLPWNLEHSPDVVGEIVWSTNQQKGFMSFRGLEQNASSQRQYQLWIFDKDRDERYPVDGGVFDIAADGEVIVPFAAKLRVQDVTLFAVTVEPEHGVVVSDRETIPCLAQVGEA